MATPIRKGGRNQPRSRKAVAESAPRRGSQSLGELPPRMPAPGMTSVQKVGEVLKRITPFVSIIKHSRVQFVATTRSAYWPIRHEMASWPHIVDPDGMARAFLAGLGTNTAELPHNCMPEGSLSMQEFATLNAHCTGQLREVPIWEELVRFYPKMTMREAISIQMRIMQEVDVLDMGRELIGKIVSNAEDFRQMAGRAVRRFRMPDREEDGVTITGAQVSIDYRIFSGRVPNSTFKVKSGMTVYYGVELTEFSDLTYYHGMHITGFTQIVAAVLDTPRGEAHIYACGE